MLVCRCVASRRVASNVVVAAGPRQLCAQVARASFLGQVGGDDFSQQLRRHIIRRLIINIEEEEGCSVRCC